MRIIALVASLTVMAFTCAGHAQTVAPPPASNEPQNFEQYPSYIEVTSKLQNGTEVALRCGYTQNGPSIMADPGYMEMSFLNQAAGTYLRYQRIDNKIIMTSPAQGTPGHFILEIVEPTGTATAKGCMFNPANDTIQNCIASVPFMTPAQAINQDQTAANQCGAFLEKATSQLDRVTYNLQKTEVFKTALRQKVRILEGP